MYDTVTLVRQLLSLTLAIT